MDICDGTCSETATWSRLDFLPSHGIEAGRVDAHLRANLLHEHPAVPASAFGWLPSLFPSRHGLPLASPDSELVIVMRA